MMKAFSLCNACKTLSLDLKLELGYVVSDGSINIKYSTSPIYCR